MAKKIVFDDHPDLFSYSESSEHGVKGARPLCKPLESEALPLPNIASPKAQPNLDLNIPDASTFFAESVALAGAEPPCTNRGVTFDFTPPEINIKSLKDDDLMLYIQANQNKEVFDGFSTDFDWYQGTVFIPGEDIADKIAFSDLIALELQAICPVFREIGKSVNRYAHSDIYWDSPDQKRRVRLCMVEYGGHNPGVHITTSGFYSASVANILRSYEARPSRVDVAIDVYNPSEGPRYFNQQTKRIIKFAKAEGLKINMQGDWATGKGGRTLYIGSRDSVCQLCIYEKGLQLNGDSEIAPANPYWTRFEFRFRPDSKAKDGLSRFNPVEWLGTVRWVRAVLQLMKIDVTKSKSIRAPKQRADADRARHYMAKQYGKTITHWIDEAGSFAEFASQLHFHLHCKGVLNP